MDYPTKKRIGRPMKRPAKGKRVSLGLKVTADVKRHIDAAARASGRTQSQEAEHLIEQGLAVADLLAAQRTTVAKQARDLAEKNLRDDGYTWTHTPYGKIYWPPGYPDAPPRSGFIDPEDKS
jgi:hypothetical protein